MFAFPGLPKVLFLGPALNFMIIYVWSRRTPDVTMNFLGLFNFKAPYLPWVMLGFGYMLGQNPTYDVLGIIAGHIYFFLADVFPQVTGRNIMQTPGLM